MPLVIAVDGPAASGKSTLARRLAQHFGLGFLDTGLLYRALARKMIDAGIDLADAQAASRVAHTIGVADTSRDDLRAEEVGNGASKVAAFPDVRSALLLAQRRFATTGRGAVLAGRDIGTVVCPDAAVKLWVTASVEERAFRRHAELQRRGENASFPSVLEEMRERDRRDGNRAVAPMVVAPDARVLDNTDMDPETAFRAAVAMVDEARAAVG
ncbi:MAG TPA: (d)CMP kinase [Geminicoccus sp.]|jgi:cytidylate kinase|uniref:(d)CMP kinase n=1 Tax=Geminicoccus sp. TaxID=2024832 RepID=UPI002E378639|nr:(d)CMP kinase [Geminicoccus sp.]HEX2526441.1 (d)CMP kinase [Geminicoccus sp.]